jgi:hypothetical protein
MYDIVQVNPEKDIFGGCFAVVSQVKENGRVIAYVQDTGKKGAAYVFLNKGEYANTGGQAVWAFGAAEGEA